MATTLNRQPIFTATPILTCITLDPPIITDNFATQDGSWATPPTTIYTAKGAYGDLIERITITSTGDLNYNNVLAKLIYLYLYQGVNKISLYKTLVMPATTISSTVPNPEIELVFTGGLLLQTNQEILIGASENQSNTGDKANYLSITIESGTYDTPS